MPSLSVNINKVASLRNARGGNVPDVVQFAIDCQKFGAEGITVHPRPDERHIRYQDVYDLKKVVYTEFNIEGYPSKEFIELVMDVLPEQVTLVPDPPDALTSNAGWDTVGKADFLKPIIEKFKAAGIRSSIFIDTDLVNIENAPKTGTDRIELYTGPYADNFNNDKEAAIAPFVKAAEMAKKMGLGVNAGHDLNLHNLKFFRQNISCLQEVSIGHALISDCLYLGLENCIQLYLRELHWNYEE